MVVQINLIGTQRGNLKLHKGILLFRKGLSGSRLAAAGEAFHKIACVKCHLQAVSLRNITEPAVDKAQIHLSFFYSFRDGCLRIQINILDINIRLQPMLTQISLHDHMPGLHAEAPDLFAAEILRFFVKVRILGKGHTLAAL